MRWRRLGLACRNASHGCSQSWCQRRRRVALTGGGRLHLWLQRLLRWLFSGRWRRHQGGFHKWRKTRFISGAA